MRVSFALGILICCNLPGFSLGQGYQYQVSCPLLRCANPCGTCANPEDECETRPTILSGWQGQECQGCPELVSCRDVAPVDFFCPRPACANPCESCGGQPFQCETEPSFFNVNGKQCPGCPRFVSCGDDFPCPRPACANPCESCGGQPFQCETEPGFFTVNGKQCPGCPKLVSCGDDIPCPVPACANPCERCGPGNEFNCETKPGFFNFNGQQCPGCPEFVSCPAPPPPPPPPPSRCCNRPPPSSTVCGRSGCTCCSNGLWFRGNSGPTRPPEEVCGPWRLQPSRPCNRYEPPPPPPPPSPSQCCSEPRPDSVTCGRSGCTCCSDGQWALGNSGPTRPARDVCNDRGLLPSRTCRRYPTACCAGPRSCRYGRCTCCSDGQWVEGGRWMCRRKGLRPSWQCRDNGGGGQQCGNTMCSPGLECCNASCGFCVPPGGVCIQIACFNN